jgi:hypothetical protein
MPLVGASSRMRGEGKKRRFESSLLYEMKSCSSVGDEVGSKDVEGLNEGGELGRAEGCADGILDGNAVGF